MQRPTGITIIAILFIVLAILSLLWSGLVFGVGGLSSLFGGLFGAEQVAAFGTSSAWSGFLGIIVALVQLAVAIGLLSMRKWAWVLALVAVALTVVQGVVGVFSGGAFAFMCGILGLIIPIAILIYLLSNRVRSGFGVGAL
jgi:hypothetical protein